MSITQEERYALATKYRKDRDILLSETDWWAVQDRVMTQEEIDIMWQQAMRQSIEDGEVYTRYHFAKLVAEREREACAKVADEWAVGWPHPSQVIAERIRARGET